MKKSTNPLYVNSPYVMILSDIHEIYICRLQNKQIQIRYLRNYSVQCNVEFGTLNEILNWLIGHFYGKMVEIQLRLSNIDNDTTYDTYTSLIPDLALYLDDYIDNNHILELKYEESV